MTTQHHSFSLANVRRGVVGLFIWLPHHKKSQLFNFNVYFINIYLLDRLPVCIHQHHWRQRLGLETDPLIKFTYGPETGKPAKTSWKPRLLFFVICWWVISADVEFVTGIGYVYLTFLVFPDHCALPGTDCALWIIFYPGYLNSSHSFHYSCWTSNVGGVFSPYSKSFFVCDWT